MAVMYITRVPNRGSPPAVLLRESCREGGQVKNRTVANLSSWPEAMVEALSRALTGLPPAGLEGMAEIARSLPHGHLVAVLGTIPASAPPAARQGRHRPGRGHGDQQEEGRQALHRRDHRRRDRLAAG
jgi:hypothetical protein